MAEGKTPTYVFVYGTLKKGYRNNILLSHSKFIQVDRTKPKYKLYDCGMYPCMVKVQAPQYIHQLGGKADGVSIEGEIYEINDDTLRRLDQLEGVPWLYQRDTIELENFAEPTLAYFYQDDVSDFAECGTSWPRKNR